MDHLLDDEELPRHERELTLSTGSILGIFLGLAILCGAFFGFGYNMGRKSAPTPLSLSDVNTDTGSLPSSNAAKPSAGTPLVDNGGEPAAAPVTRPARRTPPPTTETATTEASTSGSEAPVAKPIPTRTSTAAAPAPATPAPVVRQPAPVSASALNPSSSLAGAAAGTYMVQVAAVSHKEDSDLLVGALRSRGYTVSARLGTNDNFIHVQVGPFHDKKDADAMRQRLLTDGYNAIVK